MSPNIIYAIYITNIMILLFLAARLKLTDRLAVMIQNTMK